MNEVIALHTYSIALHILHVCYSFSSDVYVVPHQAQNRYCNAKLDGYKAETAVVHAVMFQNLGDRLPSLVTISRIHSKFVCNSIQ